ncbi:Eukaryotic translation initiation factor 3 subunit D [Paragonimus heterotremus]|uniref:Eukaryotic translation initiation factor 3 subunit D n=1 Tax=Paragonimus heterotremus TaxID=100268 RepID=A0A8J4WY82_9TREM|nr:Eukaryotic translation initiation factor 3 subunit D [Paragonimus heterotremus]
MLSETDPLPQFGLLTLHENPGGWGPLEIPKEFEDMPYQPFSKDMRLGRVADWSGNIYQDMKSKGRYMSQFSGAQYAYIHDEDDSNFQLVSSGRDIKSSNLRQRYRLPMRGRRIGVGGGYVNMGSRGGYMSQSAGVYQNRKLRNMSERDRMQHQNRRWHQWNNMSGPNQRRTGPQSGAGWRSQPGVGWGAYQDRRQPHRTVRDASVQIKDSWTLQEELDFARLSKLALPNIKEPSDLVNCGEMEYYDKSYDRVNTRNERPLVRVNRVTHTVSTTDDPIIQRLAKEHSGRVYCTDAIAASIMCCTRSVYPWDFVVTRVEDLLFFDERAKAEFDLVTVCETAAEPPNEEPGHINSAQRLSLEATYINTNLSQQMLLMGGKKFAFPEPNPFVDDEDEDDSDVSNEDGLDSGEDRLNRGEKNKEELGSIGYRYRLFDLGNQITLVVRCEVNGVLPPAANDADLPSQAPAQFVCIRALNEFDSRYCGGVDWRSKLDTQRGAVLASEIKNNAFKLAKWTACSILAGADQLKLGFVSRVNPKDSSRHVILGTQQFKPQEFALQLNLNLDNAWGILRCVIDFFMKLPEGKYLMLKDPNKAMLRIFAVPSDAFESDVTTSSDDDVRNEPRKLSDSNEPVVVDSGKEKQATNATDS